VVCGIIGGWLANTVPSGLSVRIVLTTEHDSMSNRVAKFSAQLQRQNCTSALLGAGLLAIICQMSSSTLRSDDVASAESKIIKPLLALYGKDAAEYTIYRDRERRDKLELREEPVYVWTNAVRRQHGAVYVWTWRGRPDAVASIFSNPAPIAGKRGITHELHSLSAAVLVPDRQSENRWEPQAGLTMNPLLGAPKPADSARQRTFQMRELTREFSAHSVDFKERTWELRLLTQPLFRYQSTDPDVMDGALFAFVTSEGTDPEVFLELEARRTNDGPAWYYAACRFSDFNLYVEYKKTEVWSSVRGEENVWEHDPQHLYRLFRDRRIDDVVPAASAR
jgi:hypothetical protein